MPKSDFGYNVTDGKLMQVLENESIATCYVEVTIPANGQIITTIEKKTTSTNIELLDNESLFACFPSPFSHEINIKYEIQKNSNVNISIHNMAGQRIKVLVNDYKKPGKYNIKWNATDSADNKVENGTYIYKYKLNGKQITSGQILLLR